MKNIIKVSKFISVLSLISIVFIACDNDYNSFESDIEGTQNFETNTDRFPVTAYNKRIKPLQTNNFPSNFLGIYKDAVYGQTINSIITQVVPSKKYNPDFGTNPEFTRAYLTIPYYATENGAKYDIDSLYGNKAVKLSIYRTNYFMRDFNPASEDKSVQLYYSNNTEFGSASNEVTLLYQNSAFIPNKAKQKTQEQGDDGMFKVVDSIAPSLHVQLLNPNNFWKTLLFDKKGMPELSNPNNFKDYFRGLYFKIEPLDGEGNAIMLNFNSSAANLTVLYNNEGEDKKTVRNNKFEMNFQMKNGVNRASTISVDPITNSLLNNANASADKVNGDQTLYLKGGDGAMAVVNLFDNPQVLDDFNSLYKDVKGKPTRLINEANLIFYVDQDKTAGMKDQEPNRVILYDLKNNIPVVDYFYDSSTNTTTPVKSKTNHSSLLERDANGRGTRYKIKITEHLNNILLKDSTNFQLGLYVTTNINEISNSFVLDDNLIQGISIGTALSPKGTILHGSNLNVPADKRVQLEIYYTEPNN